MVFNAEQHKKYVNSTITRLHGEVAPAELNFDQSMEVLEQLMRKPAVKSQWEQKKKESKKNVLSVFQQAKLKAKYHKNGKFNVEEFLKYLYTTESLAKDWAPVGKAGANTAASSDSESEEEKKDETTEKDGKDDNDAGKDDKTKEGDDKKADEDDSKGKKK